MLRAFAREHKEGGDRRRFPKSGGFRRKMGLGDWDVMEEITALMSLDQAGSSDNLMTDAADTATAGSDGYPSCFALPDDMLHGSDADADDGVQSPVAVRDHDNDDEWPEFCKPQPKKPTQAEPEIAPINPVAAARKRTAHGEDLQATPPPKKKAAPASSSKSAENPLYYKTIDRVF